MSAALMAAAHGPPASHSRTPQSPLSPRPRSNTPSSRPPSPHQQIRYRDAAEEIFLNTLVSQTQDLTEILHAHADHLRTRGELSAAARIERVLTELPAAPPPAPP